MDSHYKISSLKMVKSIEHSEGWVSVCPHVTSPVGNIKAVLHANNLSEQYGIGRPTQPDDNLLV